MSIVTYSEDMQTVYVRINWVNQPSTATALGATNLNKMDFAISVIDGRVVALNTTKLDKSTANTMVQDIDLDANGVFTIKKLDGTTKTYDTKLEKLAVNFEYDAVTQRLVITLDDGTKQYVDMSALITEFEFIDTATIAFTKNSTGKMSADVKNGSITEAKLQPNYLADIKVQAQNASNSATSALQYKNQAQSYAIGGVTAGDTTNNAKYFMEQARIARDEAEDISNVGVAGKDKLGLVKGNGNVEVATTGDMWADPYKDKATALKGTFITCPVADDGLLHVKEMSGETVQKVTVEGKNKFPRFKNQTQRGISLTVSEDGTITLNGTNSDTVNAIFNVPIYIDMPIGTKYGLSANNQVANGQVHIRLSSNANGEVYDIFNVPLDVINKNVLYTTTIGGKPQYATIRVGANQTLTNFTIKPQLELGPTTAYEPFAPNSPSLEYPSPLEYAKNFDVMTSNDNLFPFDTPSLIGGTAVVSKTKDEIVISGTAGGSKYVSFPNSVYLIKGQSVTLSRKFIVVSGTGAERTGMFRLQNTSDGVDTIHDLPSNMNEKSFVITKTGYYAVVLIMSATATPTTTDVTVRYYDMQVVLGTVATPYKPHKSDKKSISFSFMSLPNGVKNTIEYIDGVWTKVERVKEKVLNGTENWALNSSSIAPNTSRFSFDSTEIAKVSDVSIGAISNMFKPISFGGMYVTDTTTTNAICIYNQSGRLYIRISNEYATDVNSFKTYLVQQLSKGSPVIVQYQLATPIYTPIDPIYLTTWKGTTNLFTNSYPQVNMTVDFKSELWSRDYLQDMNNVRLDNKIVSINDKFDKFTMTPIVVATQTELDNAINNASTESRQWYRLCVHVNVENLALHGGVWYIEGFRHSSGYEWQNASTYYVGGSAKCTRAKMDNVWSSWSNILTSLDLIQSDTVSDASKPVSSAVTEALGKEIDGINNSLAVQIGSFAYNTGLVSANSGVGIAKTDKVVTVALGVKKSDDTVFSASQVVIGTIQEGFRPRVNQICTVGFHASEWGISKVGYGFIGTDGRISITPNDTTTKVASIQITYIAP